ncbi:ClpP-like prohead protease/major capsid protein fusion protein [Rahnella aceris]|jgi:ATP-dependent protease ClpP protease subunit|uniref:ClpP-like prohead protease/major capsid protein fusion protein n=1 Tax=Rahnella sp. (strain Y9602) TaxID=2703885 RepID=UPI001C27D8E7|nr:ClpP-like prohead protease/major capsid protein fusion protein [Rahnella aceris]MBU9866187.1 Clp protease ClpP [Rahnella aceris]
MKASGDKTADIYIYDEIGYWGVTARQFASSMKALGDLDHINLHIHSPGGDVFDGIAIYNLLNSHTASKTVYIDGLAASMASVIAMVGNPIIMPENAMMMIHKPWGITGGDANDMRDYADLLDKVEAVLIPSYAKKTGKTPDELALMLGEETWMTAQECLEHGFADQISTAVQAMARINSKRIEEFDAMPNALKNMITKPKATTQNQPEPQNPPVAPVVPGPAALDENTIRNQVIAAQKQRVTGIKDLFAMFGGRHQELQASCIEDIDCTVDQAKDKLLVMLGKDASPSNKNGGNAHIHAGNGNFTGDGIRQALMARAGYEDRQNDNVYNGMTLREYARMSLTERGVGVAAYNPMQMVGLAMTHTTSDFGNILLDVANKSLLQGWEESQETFEAWTKKGQLSDFKTAHRVGLGGFPSLRKVREGAEYKYVTTTDNSETIALATYGEIFSITRQAIINDDLNQLTDVPMKMGRAAKATIGDLVYAVLTGNPKLSDGKALFSSDHKNLATGAIDVTNLDAGRQLMRVQKEPTTGRTLNIRPAFLLVPTALETVANQTIKSASVKGADVNAGIINPIQNFATVIGEPRLDDNSAKSWYLAAAQGMDTIEVAYLNGVELPYIDQQEGFSSDGIATKVRIDAGVAPLDYRGLVKSSGQ